MWLLQRLDRIVVRPYLILNCYYIIRLILVTIENNTSLLGRNTFRMDVCAKVWVEYNSVDELRQLLQQYKGEPLLPIGVGSNLLFTQDYHGVLLHSGMRRARALDEDADSVAIEAEAGIVLDELIAQVVDMGLGGLENLSHIPGEVGASAVQNVGAYGVEAKDVILRVNTIEVATGKERTFENAECRYGYRDSIFKNELRGKYIVTSVVYRLEKHPTLHLDYGNLRARVEEPYSLQKVRDAVIRIRREKLPEVTDMGSAGSFFKNPFIPKEQCDALLATYPTMPHYAAGDQVKVPAAWLIEQCGCKGKQIGGAQVYEKQPLVIVNATGNATPQEVIQLAASVCDSVQKRFGITISPEVNYI